MLEQLTERVYVLAGGVNIGVIQIDDRQCVLIDSGLNDTPGRRAIKAVRDELGSDIVAIVTTHGHSDHFGANAFIVKRTGARVYAPALDDAILRYPILLTALLYGGADPPDSMRTNFLLGDSSPVDIVYDIDPITIDGLSLDVIPLAGHSPNQKGILVEGVFFAADVVLPEISLEKYRIPYVFSLTDHLVALKRCVDVDARQVVPGHGPILDDITSLRDLNLRVATQTQAIISEFARMPRTSSEIMKHVLDVSGADVRDAQAYFLIQPTIAAYVAHLARTGDLTHQLSANASTWVRG